MWGRVAGMSRVIRTTIDDLPEALGFYEGSRQVEVRVLDASDDEQREALRRLIEARATDGKSRIPAETVFDDAIARIEAKKKARQSAR